MPNLARNLRGFGRRKPGPWARMDLTHGVARAPGGIWLLNEGGGSNAWDANVNPGAASYVMAITAATYTAGLFGNSALSFNGSTAFASAGNVLGIGNGPLTLWAWVKYTTTSACNILSKQQNSGGFSGYGMSIASGGALQFFLLGSGSLILVSSSTFNDGKWHLVIWTCDATNTAAGVKLYVDGLPAATTTSANAFSGSAANTSPLQISGRAGANGLYAGTIDHCGIVQRVFSPAEAYQLYQEPFAMLAQPAPRRITRGATAPFDISQFPRIYDGTERCRDEPIEIVAY